MTDTNQEVRETPAWIATCSTCGRIVDTREKADGGDPHGCEVKDGQWACSVECYEVQIGDAPPPAVPDAVGVLRAFAESFSFTVTDSFYSDAYLSIKEPHSAHFRLGNGSQFSRFIAALEERRLAALSSIEPTPSPEPQAYYDAILSCLYRYQPMAEKAERRDLLEFMDQLRDEIGNRAPLYKLNRWLGYIQGVLIENGHTDVLTERDWSRPLFRPLDFPSPEPQAVEEDFEQEDPEITWRDLALQFDGQRILALQLLRSMVDEPGKWQDEAAEFVKAPPLSGEAVLAERIAALSHEPQASNAGAVEALRSCIEVIDDYLAYRHDGDPWSEDARLMGEMEINRFAQDGRLERARAALSTPEPQTGERDGEVKAWLLGDPATGQWIEVDGHRVAYSRGMGRPVHVLAEAFKTELARADTAEGNVNRWKARAEIVEQERIADLKLLEAELAGTKDLLRIANDQIERLGKPMNDAVAPWQALLAGAHARAETAERRLAEVEERAREDERDWLLSAADHVNTPPYRVALRLFLREHGAMEPADRAALRAKPEAQAIVGKEAGE